MTGRPVRPTLGRAWENKGAGRLKLRLRGQGANTCRRLASGVWSVAGSWVLGVFAAVHAYLTICCSERAGTMAKTEQAIPEAPWRER